MKPTVIVLCGGLGTRLREETEFRPKPMVEIGGRPILWHIMRTYAAAGLDEFVLALGYKGHMIKEYFLNYQAMTSDFTLRTGRAGSMGFHAPPKDDWSVTCAETGYDAQTGARVRKALKYCTSDEICITYGDGLADIDINQLLAFHRSHGRIGTVTSVAVASRFGEMSMEPDGQVTSFAEKPPDAAPTISGGYFVFDRERLEGYLREGDDLVFEREPIERLVADRQLVAYRHHGFWQCMDTYREWKVLEDLWATGRAPWAISTP